MVQQKQYKTLFKPTNILILVGLLLVRCYKETAIPVEASFNITFVGDDISVPVQVSIINQTVGADTFEWTFAGGEPSSSSDENPGAIVYKTAGTYTLLLKASNIDGSTGIFEKEITIVDKIEVDFSTEIVESNYPPVEVVVTNLTQGENFTYLWTFEGGTPETSTAQHPEHVIFETEGEHTITLEVSNGYETFSKETTITVQPDIEATFDWDVDFFDDDYQAPVTIITLNNSVSAISYNWTFEGGTPATSTETMPTATFNTAGTYTITLEANNGKRTHTVSKPITVYPDTNIRTFSDVELAINYAHNFNTKGAFFSTTLREVFMENQITEANGFDIDIVFLGFDSSFSLNKFVSPDEANTNGFTAIPNATHTKFINSQELCACGVSLTSVEFDAMTDDSLLKTLTITETTNGLLPFDSSTVPRIVLFETQDGRKGAIKIKDFVEDVAASYIVCDIKVQKQ